MKKGELIARIDDSRYAASLAQARQQAESLKAVLSRLVHGSRPEEIAQAKATMDGLRAIYENNETLYARTVELVPQGHRLDGGPRQRTGAAALLARELRSGQAGATCWR